MDTLVSGEGEISMLLAAETSGMEAITSALTTALTSTASAMTGAIGDVLPIALPVLGGIAVVMVGIRVFKKVTGK